MHILQSLLSAAILIAGINAAPCENPPFVVAGWEGPGTYRITNVQGRTSVDLFQGQTNIVGWQTDPNTNNQKWIITSINSGANTWAILNNGTRGAITSNGWNKQTTAQPLDTNNLSQQWTIEELGTGGAVIFHSAASPNDVLDLSYGNPNNNTPIVTYSRSGRENQQWVLELLSRDTVSDNLPPRTKNDQISLTINDTVNFGELQGLARAADAPPQDDNEERNTGGAGIPPNLGPPRDNPGLEARMRAEGLMMTEEAEPRTSRPEELRREQDGHPDATAFRLRLQDGLTVSRRRNERGNWMASIYMDSRVCRN
ncbi:hypothetical protein EPUS_07264 [Endocarpon pusillum Z07020]|uniref:Ricin B lectin domain-containing protein n=1 Tax=Endocarpon pusillum (strain Z07020 / HMAS-L-300199) TaxID=1263415 RepID=U1FVD2_ENDPU|nr:uncharacterized protein EPUS_07264 [Endocarpon pusillum Z07020]ERF68777.1 hypothetical protein EPUS_07264 [Endocarpon pusillum Z07020]